MSFVDNIHPLYGFIPSSFGGTSIFERSNVGKSRDQWLKERKALAPYGIGGSGIGTALGYDLFTDPLLFFYEKIGLRNKIRMENKYTFWGRGHEETIADKWRHWDGSDESMFENEEAGKIVRDCRKRESTMINPRYPYLFSNIDREMTLHPREKTPGVLEIKTISSQYTDRFKIKLPIKYLYQTHGYLIVTGSDYGEIVMLEDGTNLRVFPVEREPVREQEILDRSRRFMEAVRLGLQIMSQNRNDDWKLNELIKIEYQYQDMLDVSSSDKLASFLTEKHQLREQLVEVRAEADLINMVHRRQLAKAIEDQEKEKRKMEENRIRKWMSDRSIGVATWETGRVSYRKKLVIRND